MPSITKTVAHRRNNIILIMKESRNFIVTLNNPKIDVSELKEIVVKLGFTYFRGQLEKGAEGTPHIQACFGGKKFRF